MRTKKKTTTTTTRQQQQQRDMLISAVLPVLACIYLYSGQRHTCTGQQFTVTFTREKFCHLEERMALGLIKVAMETKGTPMTCSRACMYDKDCFGFSVIADVSASNSSSALSRRGGCFLHQEYFTLEECTSQNADKTHAYFAKHGVCYNGGVLSRDQMRCVCLPSSFKVGRLCTSGPRSCWDLAHAGYVPFQKATIHLTPFPNQDPVNIQCTVHPDGSSVTRIGRNSASMKGFNVTWAQYEEGFGTQDDAAYWIGLKTIHRLLQNTGTSSRLAMMIASVRLTRFTGGTLTLLDFRLSPASDGYRMSYGGHSETDRFAGTKNYCFRDSNGVRFSTYDMDQDTNAGENCAAVNGVGGWFGSSCHSPCNLFGSRYTHKWAVNDSFNPFSLDRIRIPDMSKQENSYYLPGVEFEIWS